ncbi:FAD-binding oxidoreductase [Streptomyces sp. CNS654]|uniref:FAD-binding oxidoreductase n=1 Tax=Streptomyces parvus TaxID=66428 RepID=UPI00067CED03
MAYAAGHGLRLTAHATGHGLPGAVEGGVLVVTRGLDSVAVDPVARTAVIGAGATWGAVTAAAAPHGLAPLNGSSPSVGAVSYTLGGGLGILARQFGYAADQVRALDVVTADGVLGPRVLGRSLNFCFGGGDRTAGFHEPETAKRLAGLVSQYDPAGLFGGTYEG